MVSPNFWASPRKPPGYWGIKSGPEARQQSVLPNNDIVRIVDRKGEKSMKNHSMGYHDWWDTMIIMISMYQDTKVSGSEKPIPDRSDSQICSDPFKIFKAMSGQKDSSQRLFRIINVPPNPGDAIAFRRRALPA